MPKYDVEFQIDLLRTDEINLDYVLKLILEKSREFNDIDRLKEEIKRVIKSSVDTRAKEGLVMKFINTQDLYELRTNEDVLDAFYSFAKAKKKKNIDTLIQAENLKNEPQRFIERSISRGFVETSGDDLDKIIPPVSRMHGNIEEKKSLIFEKIRNLVEVFIGI